MTSSTDHPHVGYTYNSQLVYDNSRISYDEKKSLLETEVIRAPPTAMIPIQNVSVDVYGCRNM